MAETYNGTSFSLKKADKGNPDTCDNRDEPEDVMLSGLSQSQKDPLL